MIGLGKGVYFEYQDGVMRVGSELVGTVSVPRPISHLMKFDALWDNLTYPPKTMCKIYQFLAVVWWGYFGYDLIRTIEPTVGHSDTPNPLNLPDLWLMLSTEVVIFDNLEHTLSIMVYANCDVENGYEDALCRLTNIENILNQSQI